MSAEFAYFSHHEHAIRPEDYSRLQHEWPLFMQQSQTARRYLPLRFSRFAEFFAHGVHLPSQASVCYSTGFPMHIDLARGLYPRTWDEGLGWCADGVGGPPNSLLLLDVTVRSDFRGSGLARALFARQTRTAREHGFSHVLVPVRPIGRFGHGAPDDEFLRDPWVDYHLKVGGEVLEVRHDSLRIDGSPADWREWCSLDLDRSGHYPLDGGVTPLDYDAERKVGTYRETNVLVLHRVIA